MDSEFKFSVQYCIETEMSMHSSMKTWKVVLMWQLLNCLIVREKIWRLHTWRKRKFASRGSPAPTQVQQITSALCEISRSVALLRDLYFFSSALDNSPTQNNVPSKIINIWQAQHGHESSNLTRRLQNSHNRGGKDTTFARRRCNYLVHPSGAAVCAAHFCPWCPNDEPMKSTQMYSIQIPGMSNRNFLLRPKVKR